MSQAETSRPMLSQLYGHVEELSSLTGTLTQLLLMVEAQVMPKRVRDLSLAIAMAQRLERTARATLRLANAWRAEGSKTVFHPRGGMMNETFGHMDGLLAALESQDVAAIRIAANAVLKSAYCRLSYHTEVTLLGDGAAMSTLLAAMEE